MRIKKVLTLILILLIVLFSKEVFADMSAPEIRPYTAYVSNPEGADYYKYDSEIDGYKKAGKLEYGTEIEVIYENIQNEIKYASFSNNGDYVIKTIDIKAVETEFEVDYDKSIQVIILAKDGIEMYEGPAYGFSEMGITIPKGTKLIAHMIEGIDASFTPWYYVTYKDNSGWICTLNGVVGHKNSDIYNLVLPRATKIYEDNELTKQIKELPANTLITDFLNVDMWSRNYYVTYDGTSGYMSVYDCATDWDTEFEWTVNYNDVKMYKEGSLNGEILVNNIPEGTVLKAEYMTDYRGYGWIYTTYNNKKGWVFIVEDGDDYKQLLEQELQDEKLRDEETVKAQEENNENKNEIINTTNEIITNTTDSNNSTVNNEVIITTTQKVSPTQMILLCVFVGVIIGTTGMAILLLINKKRK